MGQTILTPLQKELLSFLQQEKLFTDNFYFTGGTALSEYYLHHRLSEDLDFFCEFQEVDKTWLVSFTDKLKTKLKAKRKDLQESFNRNIVFFNFSDQIIKTEFTYFPFPRLDKTKKIGNLEIDSLQDVAVNKFFTIYQKPSARHFIDLYLIIQKGGYKWEELKKLARTKFDTVIDPIQLGSQLILAGETKDLPNMIIPLEETFWRNFFLDRARELKSEL